MNKKSVLLCYPKTGSEAYASPGFPMSMLALGTAIQKRGYTPVLIDQRVHTDWKERIRSWCESTDALAVGISTMSGPQINHALEMASCIREYAPNVPCIWGGVHPTMLPEQTLANPLCDYVVIQEGEETFPALLDCLVNNDNLEQVAGIAFHNPVGNFIQTTPRPFVSLDQHIQLDYSLLDKEVYQRGGSALVTRENSVSLYTSRGCPCRCSFCYNSVFHEATWRGASADSVVRMLIDLHSKGIRNIHLADEYFFNSIERARDICRQLQKQEMAFQFYYANCRLDQIEKMTDADLQLFAESGFKTFFIGVESGSAVIQKKIRKGVNPEALLPQLLRINKQGIIAQLSFMLGLPEETHEDRKQTLLLMEQVLRKAPMNIVPGAGKFLPFPGTESFDNCISAGWTPPEDLKKWGQIVSVEQSEWLGENQKDKVASALFVSSALDTKINSRASMILELARRLYSHAARLRCRYGWMSWVLEYSVFFKSAQALFQKKRISD